MSMVPRKKSLLAFIFTFLLLSGCGLSDDTQEQLEDAVGRAAGEALDSAKSKTANVVEELSTTIDEHGGVQGFFDRIVQFIDGLFGGSGSECEKTPAKKIERDAPRTVIKRNAEKQNYHDERSAHYACAAVDIRIKDVEDVKIRKALAKAITEDLGPRYFVLHEDVGMANEHLHFQLKSGSYNRNEEWK